jgi:hypothetical protein
VQDKGVQRKGRERGVGFRGEGCGAKVCGQEERGEGEGVAFIDHALFLYLVLLTGTPKDCAKTIKSAGSILQKAEKKIQNNP